MADQVSAAELAVACAGPAVLVNRFVVTMGPVVRLVFLETAADGQVQFRSAAAMAREDLKALNDLVTELLAQGAPPSNVVSIT